MYNKYIKRKIFIINSLILLLFSCTSNSLYKESFFDSELLKEELVEDLPIPENEYLLYKRRYGLTNPITYINVIDNISNDCSVNYSLDIYNYLKNKNFKYIYSIKEINGKYNTSLINLNAYILKEAKEFKDFNFEESTLSSINTSGYVFVYSNDSTLNNDDGDNYFSSSHCIIITKEEDYKLEYDDKTMNFNYYIKFDIHSSFWF